MGTLATTHNMKAELATLIQLAATLECDIADLLLVAQDVPNFPHGDIAKNFPTKIGAMSVALEKLAKFLDCSDEKFVERLRPRAISEVFELRHRLAHDKVIGVYDTSYGYQIKMIRFFPPRREGEGQIIERSEWSLDSTEVAQRLDEACQLVDAVEKFRKLVWSKLKGWPNHTVILHFNPLIEAPVKRTAE